MDNTTNKHCCHLLLNPCTLANNNSLAFAVGACQLSAQLSQQVLGMKTVTLRKLQLAQEVESA